MALRPGEWNPLVRHIVCTQAATIQLNVRITSESYSNKGVGTHYLPTIKNNCAPIHLFVTPLLSFFYHLRLETQFTKLLPRFVECYIISERPHTYPVINIRIIGADLVGLALKAQLY
jgi:hypothetical protein